MVDNIFGDMLFRPGPKQMMEFPSPESLKGKILISTKPPEEEAERLEGKDDRFRVNYDKVKNNTFLISFCLYLGIQVSFLISLIN